MAYDHKQDALRRNLIAAINTGSALNHLNTQDLWSRYLTSIGVTGGTLLDRMKRDADAKGIALSLYSAGDFLKLGPELAPAFSSASWTTIVVGASFDANGLHFVATDAGTIAHAIDTLDNVAYRIVWTQVLTSGSFRWQLYGDTTAHLGQTASYTTSGTFAETVSTASAGTLTNLIRANANGGGAGANTLDITYLSIKRAL